MNLKRRKGFTLVELLVASALLAIFLTIMFQFATTGYRIVHEEFERSAAEANVLLLANRLSRDLELASAAGLSLSSSGEQFALQPVTLSDLGAIVYEDRFLAWDFDVKEERVSRYSSDGVSGQTFTGAPCASVRQCSL